MGIEDGELTQNLVSASQSGVEETAPFTPDNCQRCIGFQQLTFDGLRPVGPSGDPFNVDEDVDIRKEFSQGRSEASRHGQTVASSVRKKELTSAAGSCSFTHWR